MATLIWFNLSQGLLHLNIFASIEKRKFKCLDELEFLSRHDRFGKKLAIGVDSTNADATCTVYIFIADEARLYFIFNSSTEESVHEALAGHVGFVKCLAELGAHDTVKKKVNGAVDEDEYVEQVAEVIVNFIVQFLWVATD